MTSVVLRRLSVAATCLSLAAASTCYAATEIDLVARIDASLTKAGKFLLARQSPDGAWRSETYGAFRDGPTLTPYVMSCLFYLPRAGPKAQVAYRRGVDYLAGFVDRDGRLAVGPRELLFPVYTAASASRVVVLQEPSPRNQQAQQAWLAYLRARQLNEALGWSRSDPEYGGWGFSLGVPEKPRPGQLKERFFESNLAATIFGLAALRSAKVPPDDPAYQEALVFVRRCQNFSDDPHQCDPRFDDGGFFFIPDDPIQNKAGTAGVDRFDHRRFHSYGTMTADGLRALLRCGLTPEDPRVVAAREWLESNFSAEHNPGTFEPDRAVLQDATYYYWTWAVAHAFLATRVRQIDTAAGQLDWPQAIAEALIRRQQPDGSWINRYTDAREDDPLVATPWAAASLAVCRSMLTGQRETLLTRRQRHSTPPPNFPGPFFLMARVRVQWKPVPGALKRWSTFARSTDFSPAPRFIWRWLACSPRPRWVGRERERSPCWWFLSGPRTSRWSRSGSKCPSRNAPRGRCRSWPLRPPSQSP